MLESWAGREKKSQGRCSSEKKKGEKPKWKLSYEEMGTTEMRIIWSMRDQLSSVKSYSLPLELQQQEKKGEN